MAENENEASIEVLIDDCLSTIFRHLSIVDRVTIERVSKRWNEVSKSSWSDVKKLDLNPRSWGFQPSKFLLVTKKISLHGFTEVLKRCGQFLEDIDISEIDKSKKLNAIARYCTNLRVLTANRRNAIDSIENWLSSLKERGNDPDRIKYFLDNKLSCLFDNNKKLRAFKFEILPEINGTCLLNLPLIEELDLNYINNSLSKQYFLNALKIMNHLKVFKISLHKILINDVILELQNCEHLEDLRLSGSYEKSDFPNEEIELGILFKNNQKLISLSLEGFLLKGECLGELNGNCIKELGLLNCKNFDCKYLNEYFPKLNNLEKFKYFDYYYDNVPKQYEFIKFINFSKNLKVLDVSTTRSLVNLNNFESIKMMINLEELTLKSFFHMEKYFKIFAENLKNLKKLNFDCFDTTDAGLYAITSLTKLKDLRIQGMHKITDAGFNKMPNLKKFYCKGCEKITNDGINKILNESKSLEYLIIDNCSSIDSKDLLLHANEVTKKRTNNIVLHVHKIMLDKLSNKKSLKKVEKSPFLEFVYEYPDTGFFS